MFHSSINTIVLTIILLMEKKNNKEKVQREKHKRMSVDKVSKRRDRF